MFGSNDVVRLIQPIEGTEDVIVNGDYHVSIVQSVELFESSTVSKSRILKLPGKIIAVNAEKHSNTEVRNKGINSKNEKEIFSASSSISSRDRHLPLFILCSYINTLSMYSSFPMQVSS